MQYLTRRARREGASVAELIRRMIRRETDAAPLRTIESLWEIVGIGQDSGPLIDGVPVSERPDLYLGETCVPGPARPAKRRPPNHW